jgi:hypothetical protein
MMMLTSSMHSNDHCKEAAEEEERSQLSLTQQHRQNIN